jgi:hypothetical protein
MPLYVKGSQIAPTDHAWHQLPANRLMWFRTGGVWKPVLDMWVKGAVAPGTPGGVGSSVILNDPLENNTNWATGTAAKSTVVGRTGNCMRLTGPTNTNDADLHRAPASQPSEFRIDFWFRMSTAAGTRLICQARSPAGTPIATFVESALGTFDFHVGDQNRLLVTG